MFKKKAYGLILIHRTFMGIFDPVDIFYGFFFSMWVFFPNPYSLGPSPVD